MKHLKLFYFFLFCILFQKYSNSEHVHDDEDEDFYEDRQYHRSWKYLPEECGRTRYEKIKVYNLNHMAGIAKLGQFPWMARIGNKVDGIFTSECTGALIHRYYVLTDAKCSTYADMVRLGDNFLDSEEDCDGDTCAPIPQDIVIKEHILYSLDSKDDISLLLLETPVAFNDFVQPVCLPPKSLLHNVRTTKFMYVQIAGWGYVPEANSKLAYISTDVEPNHVCNKEYSEDLDDTQICVGYINGVARSYIANPGGPLIFPTIHPYRINHVVGIASRPIKDDGLGPAVYTNVIHYLVWILDNITME